MLTLLTATGNRPDAWSMCQRWMMRQTYTGKVRWVIVDDGREAQPIWFERDGWTLDVIRPTPFWRLGENTQARNLLAGLDAIGADAWVVVIEDDDWYAPEWLAHVKDKLCKTELAGEHSARYYNVQTRVYQQLRNMQHASLCSTALSGRALETLREVCMSRPTFIDLELWRRHQPLVKLFEGQRVLGIKGLSGRGGIGMGHRMDMSRGQVDSDGKVLRQWIGMDADAYLRRQSGTLHETASGSVNLP